MRTVLQRSLLQKSEGLTRENEGLSHKVTHLNQSLRASEALRKNEASQRAQELREVRIQLDSERQRRRTSEGEEAPPEDGGSMIGSAGGVRSREWRLRADLAEATHDLALARSQAATHAEEQQRVSTELAARAATATQGVLRLQEEVKSSLGERQALMAQLDEMRRQVHGPHMHSLAHAHGHGPWLALVELRKIR